MSDLPRWSQKLLEAMADDTVAAYFDRWIRNASQHVPYRKIAGEGPELVPNEPGLYVWGADRTVDGKRKVVPRYVGRAAGSLTLRKRLVSSTGRFGRRAGRYVLAPDATPGDTAPQCTLACLYQEWIRKIVGRISADEYKETLKPLKDADSPAVRGLEAFPPAIVASFRSRKSGHPGNDLRLRHAVDWALHGGPNLEHLWVAFLPGVTHLQAELKNAAIEWRKKNGLPPLLNREDSQA